MTQQQLAVRAFQGGEPRKSLISDLETGKIANPHQKTVDALAVCLEIPPEAVEGCRLNGALDRDALGVIIGDGLLSVHQAITAGLEQIAEDIALSKGVPVSPLRAILAKLGEVGVPDWNIPARLEAAADELICLRQRFSEIDTSNPASNLVRSSALEALDRGDLVEAQDLLRRGRAAAQGFREKAAEDEAGFIADQAKIEHILLAYKNAASHYFDASKLVSSFNKALQSHYLSCQAAEFEAQGREFGENEYLNAAIDVYTAAVTLVPAIQHPREYAETMRNLGFAQANLGEREPENSRLMQAVETYRKALKSIERARHPLLWASIQHHLGSGPINSLAAQA